MKSYKLGGSLESNGATEKCLQILSGSLTEDAVGRRRQRRKNYD